MILISDMASWSSLLFGAPGPGAQAHVFGFDLGSVHAVADGVIAASLLIVAAALLVLYYRRGEGSRRECILLSLFTLFLATTGLAHFASAFALWIPDPRLEGVLNAASAVFALVTAIVFWQLLPSLLTRPSRGRLEAEIAAHLATLGELKEARQQLEERVEIRTKELAEAKQRFEIALRGSPITVFSQDRDMRYVWVHNPPTGIEPSDLVGKTDDEALPEDAATPIVAAKQRAMETGESQTIESKLALFGRERSFYLVIEPLRDDCGVVVGTTSVAVDITERKEQEDQLRLLLRELTHRSKNLLAVINAIARQTASRTRSVDDFLQRFSARLVAIGCSQDLLVADDWHGASLRTLIEQQLSAHADRFGGQIVIDGEDIVLKPEAIQNIGLALHELATNAQKYGALSKDSGHVRIHWQLGDAARLKLVWEEQGGPPVTTPERSGFGRAMIENVVGRALEGDVKLSFPTSGVRCVIEIPAAQVASR
jgi:PAS domain S-box-containing protein